MVAKHFYREELDNTNKSDFSRQSGKLISGLGSSKKSVSGQVPVVAVLEK